MRHTTRSATRPACSSCSSSSKASILASMITTSLLAPASSPSPSSPCRPVTSRYTSARRSPPSGSGTTYGRSTLTPTIEFTSRPIVRSQEMANSWSWWKAAPSALVACSSAVNIRGSLAVLMLSTLSRRNGRTSSSRGPSAHTGEGWSVARGPTPARTRRTTSGPVRTWGPRRENGLGARSRWGDRLGEWAAHRSSSHQRMSALSCRCAADGLPPATPVPPESAGEDREHDCHRQAQDLEHQMLHIRADPPVQGRQHIQGVPVAAPVLSRTTEQVRDPPRDGLKGQPHVRITCPEQHEPEIRDEQDGEDRQDERNEASQGAGQLVTLLRQIVQRLQRHMIGDAEPGQHHRDHGHRPGPASSFAAAAAHDLRPSPLLVAHGTRTAQLIRAVLVRGRSTAAGVVSGSGEQRSVGTTEVTEPAAWARPCRADQRLRWPEFCWSRLPESNW